MLYIFVNILLKAITAYIAISNLAAKIVEIVLKAIRVKNKIGKEENTDKELEIFRKQLNNFGTTGEVRTVPPGFEFMHPLSMYTEYESVVWGNTYWAASVIINTAYLSPLSLDKKYKVKSNLAELLSKDFTPELDAALEKRSLLAIYKTCTLINERLEEKLLN
jgi:hypothetical protein